jgi:hypothetical protein
VRLTATWPEITCNWQTDTQRHWFWWTTSVYVNGYSRGSADLTRRFRARSDEKAKAKAYAWLEAGRG